MSFNYTYESLRGKYSSVFAKDADEKTSIPKAGDNKVSGFANSLWNDAVKYFKFAFEKSKIDSLLNYSDPESFWEAMNWFENGDHWKVYGSRKVGDNNKWKQEFVDNETQDQMRARNAFITANWHDVTITPNLKGIDEIFEQERKATNWGLNVTNWVKYAQKYGFVWIRSILDKTENPNGTATEILCKPGSVLLTPNATSHKKIDGCWYLVYGQQVNDKWVNENYPDFDTSLPGESPKFLMIDRNNKDNTYSQTKMLNKVEIYLDDNSLETIPFDKDEFDKRIGQIAENIQAGGDNKVEPTKDDNHKKYIKEYLQWLEEKVGFYNDVAHQTLDNGGQLLQEDLLLINSLIDAISKQIFAHEELMYNKKDMPIGKRQKYPFGRYIVSINGSIVEDCPNPYLNDWRKLWHYLPNERVPERIDGRSDIEILFHTNFILDTMLSRFADDSLLATNKKPWFNVNEKKQIEEAGYSTDPLKPGYYVNQPPVFATGQSNNQYLEAYNISKQNIHQGKLGINDVSYGQRGSSSESGKHAELLLSQNATVVTGELNINLNDVIEEIVETRIMLWKEFYTEPRIYAIEGQMEEIILAEYLRQMEVIENGQTVFKDIPGIEVSVRQNSNFPNKLESEVQELMQLHNAFPDEVPAEMILDYVANRFPSLGRNGKYRKESEFAKIGKQVVEQQQQQTEQQQSPLDAVKKKVQNRLTTEAANKIISQQNGVQNGTTSGQ